MKMRLIRAYVHQDGAANETKGTLFESHPEAT